MHNQATKQTCTFRPQCRFRPPDGTMRCQGRFFGQERPFGNAWFHRADGTYRSNRRGVSLLEVMFSIGIVMIGLLGVAALLPLAGLQISKGIIADHAASLGRAAVHDFQVRGMANPGNWRVYDASSDSFRAVQPGELNDINSFCIDPRAVAVLGAKRFPYGGGTNWMPRITLVSGAGGIPDILGLLQAEQLFVSQDELLFDLPGDRTLGPVQNFGINNEKRQTKGRMSWMATVVPKLDRQGNSVGEYTLFVVVFSQRILDADSEPVALVADFYAGSPAWGGGDVLLETRTGRPSDDLALREGDWVMLSGKKFTQGAAVFVPVHQWYQVVAVGDEPYIDTNHARQPPARQDDLWVRDVTLVGPDWDHGSLVSGWAAEDLAVSTQVTIVRGVVSVFQKTIRLETSSLWTD